MVFKSLPPTCGHNEVHSDDILCWLRASHIWIYKTHITDVHWNISIYTYTHTHIYTYTHIHTYTYIHIYIHIYLYIYIHIYIHTHIYIYIKTHINIIFLVYLLTLVPLKSVLLYYSCHSDHYDGTVRQASWAAVSAEWQDRLTLMRRAICVRGWKKIINHCLLLLLPVSSVKIVKSY